MGHCALEKSLQLSLYSSSLKTIIRSTSEPREHAGLIELGGSILSNGIAVPHVAGDRLLMSAVIVCASSSSSKAVCPVLTPSAGPYPLLRRRGRGKQTTYYEVAVMQ